MRESYRQRQLREEARAKQAALTKAGEAWAEEGSEERVTEDQTLLGQGIVSNTPGVLFGEGFQMRTG